MVDDDYTLISIHGPRVGADLVQAYFESKDERFQSTAPVWGPTAPSFLFFLGGLISIHGPRVGADSAKTL